MAMWVVVEDFCDEGGHNNFANQILGIYQTYDEAMKHIADNIPKNPVSFSGITDNVNYWYEVGIVGNRTISAVVNRRVERIDFNDPKKKLSGDSIVANCRLRSSDFI